MYRSLMFGKLGYRSLRGLQISTVFFFTLCVQEGLRYPRAGWTGFALMIIYGGFDNGATLLRAYNRFWGMLLGLFSGYILWFISHLDYRLLLLILPINVFLAYYLVGQGMRATIFTVNTSLIGTGYFDTSITVFPVTFFLTDYLMATVIALAIIVVFEYFWFSQTKIMSLFIRDKQTEVIRKLAHLVHLINAESVRRSDWFGACVTYTDSLFEMQTLVDNAQFLKGTEHVLRVEFKQFFELNSQIFIHLKALYVASGGKQHRQYDYNRLHNQVRLDLQKLKQLVRDAHQEQQKEALNALSI